tara:strand:- start:31066 stop:32655 length:1590 start_codon:yes stop_codon:yes gene_type:complete
MAISLKHAFNSGKTDGADATLVQPSNWNAEHTLQMATSKLLGRTTASTGAAEEIAVSGDLSLASGTLGLASPLATALPVTSGGTGKTTANAALTNLTTFTTTATAAGTTTLTSSSTYFQYFTGTTTQTITLPVTSTLAQGWSFHIVNNSTGNLTVNSSGGNLVITVLPGITAMVTCILITGTTAASWEAGLTDFSTVTGTGAVVLATSPTLVTPALGTPASGVLTNATGLPLTTGVTGTLPVANGGTGVTGSTGTGSVVLSTSPTLVTPLLGTPTSGTLTNATGLPISTGVSGLGSGVATFLATPSSANLATAVTDETGTGSLVFATSPTFVTPILGTPTSGTLTNATGLPISTGVSGLGAGVATFLATPSSTNLASAVTGETGSGALVFATSPTLVTPVLGTPTSGTLSSCTVDGTDAVGFRNVPVNSQSAAYTLVLADSGKCILHPSTDANARTFTIPANGSVAYPIGTAITFINMTSNVVTIAITTDTMYLSPGGTTGSRSLAQYGSATAIKITSTNWVISGSGLT